MPKQVCRRHKHTFAEKRKNGMVTLKTTMIPTMFLKRICLCGDKIIENGVHKTRKTTKSVYSIHDNLSFKELENTYGYETKVSVRAGKQCTKRLGLDHIKPLMEQKGRSEKELDWSYYWLDNMQTLCKPCHKEKTKQDRKNNA